MIAEGLEGHSDDGGRDLTIDAMTAVAERLSHRYPIAVSAIRYPERGWTVDGFMVWTGPVAVGDDTEWTGPTALVPVRRRHRILGRWVGPWRQVQAVPAAAAEVGAIGRAGKP